MAELDRLARDFHWCREDHLSLQDGVWRARQSGEVSYPENVRDLCHAREDDSYWFQHRSRVLCGLAQHLGFPPAIWDIGAGNGSVSRAFQDAGIEAVAVEPSAAGAANAAARGVRSVLCAKLEDLALPAGCLPAAGCFDVIEHIEAPSAFLAEVARILKPGGLFLVTVPAMPALWSEFDDVSGHFRRYTRRGLDASLAEHEFRRVISEYLMCCLVLPVLLGRVVPYRLGRRMPPEQCWSALSAQLKPRQGLADRLISTLLKLETGWGRFLPCGTSVVGVYAKAG